MIKAQPFSSSDIQSDPIEFLNFVLKIQELYSLEFVEGNNEVQNALKSWVLGLGISENVVSDAGINIKEVIKALPASVLKEGLEKSDLPKPIKNFVKLQDLIERYKNWFARSRYTTTAFGPVRKLLKPFTKLIKDCDNIDERLELCDEIIQVGVFEAMELVKNADKLDFLTQNKQTSTLLEQFLLDC